MNELIKTTELPRTLNGTNDNELPEPLFTIGKEIAAALASARDKCLAAEKDSLNKYHNYRYASAESVISAAKEALCGSGLTIIPQRHKLKTQGSGNQAVYFLDRWLVLAHASGDSIPLVIEDWPVIPDKGRPLDKALAIALTSSIAYLLRDLLQMPRVDPDEDMPAREDKTTPTKAMADSPDRVSDVQLDRIAVLIKQCNLDTPEHRVAIGKRLCNQYHVKGWTELSSVQADEIERGLERLFQQKAQTPV